jgi:hypothetical protein
MSSLDWESFRDADLSAFGATAEIWGAYISADDLRGALIEDIEVLKDTGDAYERDDFDGEVAGEVRQQAKRIVELHEEDLSEFAARIQACCEDAEGEFRPLQDSLKELLQGANVYIYPTGGPGEERFEVSESSLYNYLSGSGTVGPMLESQADQYERDVRTDAVDRSVEFKDLMDAAREVDDKYKAAFLAINDEPPPLPPFVGSADYLEKAAAYDAERAAELLNGGEDGQLSEAELDEFNAVAGYWGDNPLFATNLMNELGPECLYTGLGDIAAIDRSLNPETIQQAWENLGVTLATATDPSRQPHVDETWIEAFMEQGMTVMHDPDAPQGMQDIRGYQLVAPLLTSGDYATDFIVPVTDEMLVLDSQDLWYDVDDAHGLSLAEHGDNPVNYALDALDRNPEAALEFFSGDDRDLTVSNGDSLNPMEYLMERTAVGPHVSPDLSLNADMIGNAFEAAATGLPSDTPIDGDTPRPEHTQEQALFTERLMAYSLDHAEWFTGFDNTVDAITPNWAVADASPLAPMLDNMGDITAHYIEDFHRALASDDGTDQFWLADSYGAATTFANPGDGNAQMARDWFQLLGHDEQALGTAWGASEALMYTELTEAATDPDQWSIASQEVVGLHSLVAADLTIGGLDAIADDATYEASIKNSAVDWAASGANFVFSTHPDAAPANSLGFGTGVSYLAEWAKDSPSEIAAQIQADQNAYLESGVDGVPPDATTAQIEAILSQDPNHLSNDVKIVGHNYYEQYTQLLSTYLEDRS